MCVQKKECVLKKFLMIICVMWVVPVSAWAHPASFADLVDAQKNAVVNISTTQVTQSGVVPGMPLDFFKDFFRNMPAPAPREKHALGSGFIISSDGYVVTNNHVVEHADKIVVKTAQGDEYKAKLVGRDAKLDVALLKIEAKGLDKVSMGSSEHLRVGDWVVSIGNPFGLEQTVTAGIVSAKGRVIGAGPYDHFIQTDAAINPGNSGGPLFNAEGEVVGINTAIFSRSGGSNGIGFAIPIQLALPVIEELRATGHVQRARLGVAIDAVSKDVVQALGLKNQEGALVLQVEAGSAADKAGIEPGDVIIKVDQHVIRRVSDLPIRIASHKAGDKVKLRLVRQGKEMQLWARVEAMPDAKTTVAVRDSALRLGMKVRSLTSEDAHALGTQVRQGVLVVGVAQGSSAHRSGIRKGDVIYSMAGQNIRNLNDFQKVISSVKKGQAIQCMIDRNGNQVFTIVRVLAD